MMKKKKKKGVRKRAREKTWKINGRVTRKSAIKKGVREGKNVPRDK